MLPEIIPLLEKGLESDDPEVRQGVCIGLSEIVKSTSRDMVIAFINNLVPTVRLVNRIRRRECNVSFFV